MKDIKSFCKLFDLNVPSYENIDYYIMNEIKNSIQIKEVNINLQIYYSNLL